MTTTTTTTTTYRLDLNAMTVIAIDEHGAESDLSATGEPCRGLADLRRFALELKEQGLPIPDELINEYWGEEWDEVVDRTYRVDFDSMDLAPRYESFGFALDRYSAFHGIEPTPHDGEQERGKIGIALSDLRQSLGTDTVRELLIDRIFDMRDGTPECERAVAVLDRYDAMVAEEIKARDDQDDQDIADAECLCGTDCLCGLREETQDSAGPSWLDATSIVPQFAGAPPTATLAHWRALITVDAVADYYFEQVVGKRLSDEDAVELIRNTADVFDVPVIWVREGIDVGRSEVENVAREEERRALDAGMDSAIRLGMHDGDKNDFEALAPEQQRRDETVVYRDRTFRSHSFGWFMVLSYQDIQFVVRTYDGDLEHPCSTARFDHEDDAVNSILGKGQIVIGHCDFSEVVDRVDRHDTGVQYEADAEAYDDTQTHLAELAYDEEIENHRVRHLQEKAS